MGKNEADRTIADIKRYIRKWAPILGIEDVTLTCEFYRSDWPHRPDSAAQTKPSWPYMTAYLEWNIPVCIPYHNLEELVVHELIHVLAQEWDFRNSTDKKGYWPGGMERVTTLLSKALLRARDSRK